MGVQEHLKDLYQTYRAGLPVEYRWEDERDRWHELIFTLFVAKSGMDETPSRRIVSSLADLNLLDIDTLAPAVTRDGRLDSKSTLTSCLMEILVTNGLEEGTARGIILSICEMANSILGKHRKLQGLLRVHAENLLNDLANTISLSGMDEQTKRQFLTIWVQNALEMPILGPNPYIDKFCKEKGCNLQDLLNTADELDINTAVLDDLLELYYLDTERQLSLDKAQP